MCIVFVKTPTQPHHNTTATVARCDMKLTLQAPPTPHTKTQWYHAGGPDDSDEHSLITTRYSPSNKQLALDFFM